MKAQDWWQIAFIIFLLALVAKFVDAEAATNLPVTCSMASAEGKFVGECNTGVTAATGYNEYYAEALPDTLVRTCRAPVAPAVNGCSWSDQEMFRYRRFKDVPANGYVDVCLDDVPIWSRDPYPWSAATSVCKNWRGVLKKDVAQTPIVTGGAATSVAVSWVRATWMDGTALPDSHTYTIYRRVPKLYPTTYEAAMAEVSGFAATVPNQAGLRCFSIATNVGAVQSDRSREICKQFRPAAPSNGRVEAPTNGAIVLK